MASLTILTKYLMYLDISTGGKAEEAGGGIETWPTNPVSVLAYSEKLDCKLIVVAGTVGSEDISSESQEIATGKSPRAEGDRVNY